MGQISCPPGRSPALILIAKILSGAKSFVERRCCDTTAARQIVITCGGVMGTVRAVQAAQPGFSLLLAEFYIAAEFRHRDPL
jgi:hypothetical protein